MRRNLILPFVAGALALGVSFTAPQAATLLPDAARGVDAGTAVTPVEVPPDLRPRVPGLPPRCRRGECIRWGFCERRYDYIRNRPTFYRCCRQWGLNCGP